MYSLCEHRFMTHHGWGLGSFCALWHYKPHIVSEIYLPQKSKGKKTKTIMKRRFPSYRGSVTLLTHCLSAPQPSNHSELWQSNLTAPKWVPLNILPHTQKRLQQQLFFSRLFEARGTRMVLSGAHILQKPDSPPKKPHLNLKDTDFYFNLHQRVRSPLNKTDFFHQDS